MDGNTTVIRPRRVRATDGPAEEKSLIEGKKMARERNAKRVQNTTQADFDRREHGRTSPNFLNHVGSLHHKGCHCETPERAQGNVERLPVKGLFNFPLRCLARL